jgi:hypothetical protein
VPAFVSGKKALTPRQPIFSSLHAHLNLLLSGLQRPVFLTDDADADAAAVARLPQTLRADRLTLNFRHRRNFWCLKWDYSTR